MPPTTVYEHRKCCPRSSVRAPALHRWFSVLSSKGIQQHKQDIFPINHSLTQATTQVRKCFISISFVLPCTLKLVTKQVKNLQDWPVDIKVQM